MYAVIFIAKIAEPDEEYTRTAEQLRQIAIEQYGCREFSSCTEGDREIAISYWDSEDQIRAWKKDAGHRAAQRQGRERWYRSYSVQVVEVKRGYRHPAPE